MRGVISGVVGLVLLVSVGVAVGATPPGNDSIAGAVPVTELPFQAAGNSEGSSAGPEDQHSACLGDVEQSVWFTYTPAIDHPLDVEVDADFDPALEVFRGADLESIGCSFDGYYDGRYRTSLRLDVTAGETYFVRVANPYYWGGDYEISLDTYVPLKVDVSIGDLGRVTSGGRAEVPVTVTCSEPVQVDLYIDGRQALGPLATFGDGYALIDCNGTNTVKVLIDQASGAFLPGRLDATWDVYACTENEDWWNENCHFPSGNEEALLLPS